MLRNKAKIGKGNCRSWFIYLDIYMLQTCIAFYIFYAPIFKQRQSISIICLFKYSNVPLYVTKKNKRAGPVQDVQLLISSQDAAWAGLRGKEISDYIFIIVSHWKFCWWIQISQLSCINLVYHFERPNDITNQKNLKAENWNCSDFNLPST